MAAAAGIFNHAMTAGQTLAGASPMTGLAQGTDSTEATSSTSSDSATISANDFLTLLVTEMQNQDPTATTDPNEYINQLVNVNSLEQLISINQELSGVSGTSSSATATPGSSQASGTASGLTGASASASTSQAGGSASRSAALAGIQSFSSGAHAVSNPYALAAARKNPGNLSVPDARAAAHTVAHALDGRSPKASISSRLSAAQ